MITTDIHALSGAYALDSVDDVERVAFERHLRDCETCAQEVRELRETVTRLADAAAVPPPPGLRPSVLAAISRTPQVRPARPERGSAASAARWRRFAAVSVAAGVAAVGIGFGTWTVADQRVDRAREGAAADRARVAEIETVLAASDARIRVAQVDGGRVNLVVSDSQDKTVAALSGLPVPTRGLVYQLWVIRGSGAGMRATPKDVLPPGRTDLTTILTGTTGADTIGITREQPGGAQVPNTDEVVTMVDLR